MKTKFLIFLLVISVDGYSQKSKKMGGLVFGANINQFHRTNNDIFTLPSKPNWNWHAGISTDPIHTKLYALRWELKYTNKGAEETFSDDLGTKIKSNVNLAYVQTNLFPIVLMPLKKEKFNPYIALGGYYSYLAKANYKLTINQTPEQADELASKYSNKQDYGAAAALGFYVKRISLEYRIEAGIPYIIDQTKTQSTIKNNTHGIIITFR